MGSKNPTARALATMRVCRRLRTAPKLLDAWQELKQMAKKTAATKRRAAKRELLTPGTDKRFVRRGATGTFKESDDVGRSLSQDQKRDAKTESKPGQGDKGDRVDSNR